MCRSLIHAVVVSLVAAGAAAAQDRSLPEPARPRQTAALGASGADTGAPLVQLAILLDNSGSMSGLIEQAKSELWRLVNELTAARQQGRQPRLQVALYLYGDPPPQRLSDLTDDLDKVSESLFAVTISGGSEHCGQVIQAAVRELAWSDSPHDLKLIFIAGNEPFTQGPVDYRESCREAIAKGIMVNTVHCGEGIPEDWRDGALLAEGRAVSINHDAQVAYVAAPQDSEIARLGAELNRTYIPFGAAAAAGQERQAVQDANASNVSLGSSVQRAVAKANALYRNTAWDLVDAVKEGQVQLADVKTEDLPENMRGMSLAEREHYLTQQSAERQQLQDRINRLNAERNAFVAAEQQRAAQSGERTLDQALVETLRSQAGRKDFVFAEAGR